VAKTISCIGNGIWTNVLDSDDLVSILTGYNAVLATGLDLQHAIWTEPY